MTLRAQVEAKRGRLIAWWHATEIPILDPTWTEFGAHTDLFWRQRVRQEWSEGDVLTNALFAIFPALTSTRPKPEPLGTKLPMSNEAPRRSSR